MGTPVVLARSAFRDQRDVLGEYSPLLGRWCDRVATGRAISDETLLALLEAGLDTTRWVGPRTVLAAAVALAHLEPDPFRARVPTLGGTDQVDGTFDGTISDLLDRRRPELLDLCGRMLVANDPATGVDLWHAAQRVDLPADVDLLVAGAGAGLELVADGLDPSLVWDPATRRGIDLRPIDLAERMAPAWLLGICPPDDLARHRRTAQAIAVAKERGVRVEEGDVLETVRSWPSRRPLVLMAASLLCMLDEPAELVRAIAARTGCTYLVSDEVAVVHRRAGLGEGLQDAAPGDRRIRVGLWRDGTHEGWLER